MPISISPTISSVNINGNTYIHTDWENNTPGTISGLANDISSQITLLELVGILTKAIGDGTTTLTGPESTNLGFVFTGALAANATIVFAAGFVGIAQIENQTTGGFSLVCGLVAGSTVTVPPLGSAAIFCDGTNFTLDSGVVRTSTGAKVTGSFQIVGTASVSGAMTVGGVLTGADINLSGNQTVTGAQAIGGSQTIGVDQLVSGAQTVTGAMNGSATFNLVGAATIGGALSVVGDVTAVDAVFKTLEVYNSGAVESRHLVSADNGQAAWIQYNSGTGLQGQRWLVGKGNDLETGGNVGSDLWIVRLDDDGDVLDIAIRIKRDTGHILFSSLPTSSGGLAGGTIWNDAGTVKVA